MFNFFGNFEIILNCKSPKDGHYNNVLIKVCLVGTLRKTSGNNRFCPNYNLFNLCTLLQKWSRKITPLVISTYARVQNNSS